MSKTDNRTAVEKGTKLFWSLAEKLYEDPKVKEGTMMGFKCLRSDGAFFATLDHRSGALITKFPKERVLELVESGTGQPFAPAGRVFKEWVSIPTPDRKQWNRLLEEAKRFVQQN